jgi:glutamate-1-semialdehyde 2,1-aminomutase
MTLEFLDLLVELGRTDVRLQFTTNFTRVSDRMIQRLTQFKNLELIISLEGVGAMNDYLRYPSQWAEIEHNVQRVRAQGLVRVAHIHHVLQHTSAYALPALVEWCQENLMRLTLTYVQGNPCLTPESIPPADLAAFVVWARAKNPGLRWTHQIKTAVARLATTQFDPGLHQQFRQYVQALDQSRGTCYDDVFRPSSV